MHYDVCIRSYIARLQTDPESIQHTHTRQTRVETKQKKNDNKTLFVCLCCSQAQALAFGQPNAFVHFPWKLKYTLLYFNKSAINFHFSWYPHSINNSQTESMFHNVPNKKKKKRNIHNWNSNAIHSMSNRIAIPYTNLWMYGVNISKAFGQAEFFFLTV